MNAGGEAVWKGSKVPDAAYRWVAFMEGKEGQRIWSGLGTDLLPGLESRPDAHVRATTAADL